MQMSRFFLARRVFIKGVLVAHVYEDRLTGAEHAVNCGRKQK